jgi:trans-aconitate methyltransferase
MIQFMTLPGVEPLRGWVRTTWLPYLERVPPERRSEFVDELVTRYVGRHPPDAEGCVHVAMVRLEAELVKDDCTDDTPLC